MAHRLLRSIVFSSVVLLEGSGCSLSHGRDSAPPLDPPDGGASGDGGPPEIARPPRLDAGWLDDAGQLRDAEAIRDAWLAPEDAGRDSGLELGDGGDLRMCEEGWPPTKAYWCVLEGDSRLCCRGPEEDRSDCCVQPIEGGS
jgi:hypothetical protein